MGASTMLEIVAIAANTKAIIAIRISTVRMLNRCDHLIQGATAAVPKTITGNQWGTAK